MLPTPVILRNTVGSPWYLMLPAPETVASSVSSTLTVMLPVPLRSALTQRLLSSGALKPPAPVILMSWFSVVA